MVQVNLVIASNWVRAVCFLCYSASDDVMTQTQHSNDGMLFYIYYLGPTVVDHHVMLDGDNVVKCVIEMVRSF